MRVPVGDDSVDGLNVEIVTTKIDDLAAFSPGNCGKWAGCTAGLPRSEARSLLCIFRPDGRSPRSLSTGTSALRGTAATTAPTAEWNKVLLCTDVDLTRVHVAQAPVPVGDDSVDGLNVPKA